MTRSGQFVAECARVWRCFHVYFERLARRALGETGDDEKKAFCDDMTVAQRNVIACPIADQFLCQVQNSVKCAFMLRSLKIMETGDWRSRRREMPHVILPVRDWRVKESNVLAKVLRAGAPVLR